MVHATLRILHGDVKELVMELLFMGLDTLRTEDKNVCFLHPNNPSQQAKKSDKICPPSFNKSIQIGWFLIKISPTSRMTSEKDANAPITSPSG
jgi:hypothetical protein